MAAVAAGAACRLALVLVLCAVGANAQLSSRMRHFRAERAFAAARAIDAKPVTKQGPTSYITVIPDSTFVAPNCKALWDVTNYIRSLLYGPSFKSRFTIELPCAAGTVPGRPTLSWATPDYNCYDTTLSPETNGSLSMVFTTPRKATITIRAYKWGGCDLITRSNVPEITGGAPFVKENGGGYTFFTFGTDNAEYVNLMTVFLQNFKIRGKGLRPGIEAYGAKLLQLRGVDILNTTDVYDSAGLLVVDTKTKWTCTRKMPCLMYGSTTYGYDPLVFPGGGGAVGIQAINSFGQMFTSAWVNYKLNSHTHTGGVYFIYKLQQKSIGVSFNFAGFDGNTAGSAGLPGGGCAVGTTFRDDGGYQDLTPLLTNVPIYGLPIYLKLLRAFYKDNSGPTGTFTSLQICGVRAANTSWTPNQVPTIMPYKWPTKVIPTYPLTPSPVLPSVVPVDAGTWEFGLIT